MEIASYLLSIRNGFNEKAYLFEQEGIKSMADFNQSFWKKRLIISKTAGVQCLIYKQVLRLKKEVLKFELLPGKRENFGQSIAFVTNKHQTVKTNRCRTLDTEELRSGSPNGFVFVFVFVV